MGYRRVKGGDGQVVEARAEKLAEAALLAADVPGLLAEIERLRAELAGRPMARCSTVGCDSTTDGSHYWTCQGCARKAEAECERLRGSIAVEKKWRKDADDRAEVLIAEIERLRDLDYEGLLHQREGELMKARLECKLREHQLITCGVAATHPDPNLTRTGAYADKWDSQPAEEVRQLRAERDNARAALAALKEGV